jgi:hypothetical protein
MAESARPLHQPTESLVAASGRARKNKRMFLKLHFLPIPHFGF